MYEQVDGHVQNFRAAITSLIQVLHGRTTNRVWSHHQSCVIVSSSRSIYIEIYQSHNTQTHQFLYHVILPWDAADVVIVVLEVNTHNLGVLFSTIPALYVPHLLQHGPIPLSTRYDRTRIMLCRQRHALTMILTMSCFCCIIERWASIPNAFSTTLRARESR